MPKFPLMVAPGGWPKHSRGINLERFLLAEPRASLRVSLGEIQRPGSTMSKPVRSSAERILCRTCRGVSNTVKVFDDQLSVRRRMTRMEISLITRCERGEYAVG